MAGWMHSRSSRPSRGRRVAVVAVGLLLVSAAIASAHDMFIKPNTFFVAENTNVLVRIVNGTFTKSENSIDRNRVQDVSVVSPAGRAQLDTSVWTVAGDTSTFEINTTTSGTYVLGASTRPNVIELAAKDFNLYLKDDGIPDALADRRRNGELNRPAKERYSKHVKALLQVGQSRSEHFATELGYPAELVPLSNPYSIQPGSVLRVRTLVDGKPAARQFVLYGGRTATGARIEQRSLRSDSTGVARIPLRTRGTWYVKFINMTKIAGDPAADYESKWATLTFQVR